MISVGSRLRTWPSPTTWPSSWLEHQAERVGRAHPLRPTAGPEHDLARDVLALARWPQSTTTGTAPPSPHAVGEQEGELDHAEAEADEHRRPAGAEVAGGRLRAGRFNRPLR